MEENIIGQPLVEVTVFQCPLCLKVIRNKFTKIPYSCPICGQAQLVVRDVEYEEKSAIKPEII